MAKTPKAKETTKKTKPKAAAGKKASSTAKARPAPKKRARPARQAPEPASTGFDLNKIIDHPLVADLLTVGAMAAVAAIADHNVKTRTGESEAGSSKAVKAAGKAAAAAVGKRLMTEVKQLRQPPKDAD